MLDDIYHVVSFDNFLSYKFKSIGPNGVIEKVVRYREYGSPGIFNLGFGDVCPKTNFEDDLSVTNNGDSKKVLKTVASTMYTFFEHHSDALVVACGSTETRTRLYQIGISTNIEAIERDFIVSGYYDGAWVPFEIGPRFGAFLVERKS